MSDERREAVERLLHEIRQQAHDVGWNNACAAMTRRDVGRETLEVSRGGADVLQAEDAELLALMDTPEEPEPVAWLSTSKDGKHCHVSRMEVLESDYWATVVPLFAHLPRAHPEGDEK